MTVQNIDSNLLAALNGAGSSSGGASSSSGGVQQMSDQFLNLLITQMQNQDPMNPMDNTQITTQLAQLSTVEGINNLNTSLQGLLGSYQASQTLQAASLVGHAVLAEGAGLTLSGGQAGGGLMLDRAADRVSVSIEDGAGKVVRTLELGAQDAGVVTFGWDGTGDAGQQLPDGGYQIAVTATANGQQVTATPLSLDQVGSVSVNGGELDVNLTGLGKVPLSQLVQIY
jgi:flagellar basal-body rod modification protein FlgD